MVPFSLALARAAQERSVVASFSVSAEGALAPMLADLRADFAPVSTFHRAAGALRADKLLRARADLAKHVAAFAPDAVVVLMGHIWTPLTFGAMRARPTTRVGFILHDFEAHPGDGTAHVTPWINRSARHADRVLCLSQGVAEAARTAGLFEPSRLRVLFHPIMGAPIAYQPRNDDALRVLFFGRLQAYRGLAITVEAVERLRAAGRPVRLGVFGEGDLTPLRTRLEAIDAEVQNRWIAEEEVPEVLAQHDVMALSHIEASQSGAAALALGAGMPLVVTPIGALPEQTGDGAAGVVASAATGEAFAAALESVLAPGQLARLRAGARTLAEAHSPARFLDQLVAAMR